MDALLPWLALAGLGALHGLSPANGWMFAAACGLHTRDHAQARRALWPIAIGHTASIALVVAAAASGMLMDRALVQGIAGGALLALAAYRGLRSRPRRGYEEAAFRGRAGQVGIAAWSCLMATVHGAGLMLVPALIPLCMSDTPAREITASGSLALALAAVAVHMATMLLTTGAIATGVCRGLALWPRLLRDAWPAHAWTAILALTGTLLVAMR